MTRTDSSDSSSVYGLWACYCSVETPELWETLCRTRIPKLRQMTGRTRTMKLREIHGRTGIRTPDPLVNERASLRCATGTDAAAARVCAKGGWGVLSRCREERIHLRGKHCLGKFETLNRSSCWCRNLTNRTNRNFGTALKRL